MSASKFYPVIFTDLDGTLLDHHSYSAEPAAMLVNELLAAGVAEVVPVTSKTQAELGMLDHVLPFARSIKISENGSIIATPMQAASLYNLPGLKVLGVTYAEILEVVNALPVRLRCKIKGFADMSVPEVVGHTGLSPDEAIHAKDRQATEPFLWSGGVDEMQELAGIMAKQSVHIQRGGRFFHMTGSATKWQAIKHVMDVFRHVHPDYNYVVIALGDGPNDLEMIEHADYGVIIPNDSGAVINSVQPHVRVARKPGPAGWVDAVTEILCELGLL